MKKKKGLISLEYCHVTPDLSWDQEIFYTNEHAPRMLAMYPDWEIQKCIMIDDLHAKDPIDDKFLKKLMAKLKIKPDTIYLESDFVFMAAQLEKMVDPKIALSRKDNERIWLKKMKDEYGSLNEFLFSWRKKDGTVNFACPTLVATSYLYRLGSVDNAKIKPIWGETVRPATKLISLLSSTYLQVESNAHLIMNATFPQLADRPDWYFY